MALTTNYKFYLCCNPFDHPTHHTKILLKLTLFNKPLCSIFTSTFSSISSNFLSNKAFTYHSKPPFHISALNLPFFEIRRYIQIHYTPNLTEQYTYNQKTFNCNIYIYIYILMTYQPYRPTSIFYLTIPCIHSQNVFFLN